MTSDRQLTAAQMLERYRYALARSAADIPRLVEVFKGRWHKAIAS